MAQTSDANDPHTARGTKISAQRAVDGYTGAEHWRGDRGVESIGNGNAEVAIVSFGKLACVGAQSVPSGWKIVQVRYTNQIPVPGKRPPKRQGHEEAVRSPVLPDWKASPLASGAVAAGSPDGLYLHPFETECCPFINGSLIYSKLTQKKYVLLRKSRYN